VSLDVISPPVVKGHEIAEFLLLANLRMRSAKPEIHCHLGGGLEQLWALNVLELVEVDVLAMGGFSCENEWSALPGRSVRPSPK
jgi:hypothetical protein